jgi:hypothetical protein
VITQHSQADGPRVAIFRVQLIGYHAVMKGNQKPCIFYYVKLMGLLGRKQMERLPIRGGQHISEVYVTWHVETWRVPYSFRPNLLRHVVVR